MNSYERKWLIIMYMAFLLFPVVLYFKFEVYLHHKSIAPVMLYCVLVTWFRPTMRKRRP